MKRTPVDDPLTAAARQLGRDIRAARGEPEISVKRRHRAALRDAKAKARRRLVAYWRTAHYPWNLRHPEPAAPTGSARRLAGPGVGHG